MSSYLCKKLEGRVPEKLSFLREIVIPCNMSTIPSTTYIEEGVESKEDLQGFPVADGNVHSALHCTKEDLPRIDFVTPLFADVTMPARETLTLASGHAVRCGAG